jgi:hypothetical protein
MYAQAPADDTGIASGLFRTAQYIGAIFSASIIGLVYGRHATDGGLHVLALVFVALATVLSLGLLLDRTISLRPAAAIQNAAGTAASRAPRAE